MNVGVYRLHENSKIKLARELTIKRLRNPPARNLKAEILYRLDISGKPDKEKLETVEEIREILQERVKDKEQGG